MQESRAQTRPLGRRMERFQAYGRACWVSRAGRDVAGTLFPSSRDRGWYPGHHPLISGASFPVRRLRTHMPSLQRCPPSALGGCSCFFFWLLQKLVGLQDPLFSVPTSWEPGTSQTMSLLDVFAGEEAIAEAGVCASRMPGQGGRPCFCPMRGSHVVLQAHGEACTWSIWPSARRVEASPS